MTWGEGYPYTSNVFALVITSHLHTDLIALSSWWPNQNTRKFAHQFTIKRAALEGRQIGFCLPKVNGDSLACFGLSKKKLTLEPLLLFQDRNDANLDNLIGFSYFIGPKLDVHRSSIYDFTSFLTYLLFRILFHRCKTYSILSG